MGESNARQVELRVAVEKSMQNTYALLQSNVRNLSYLFIVGVARQRSERTNPANYLAHAAAIA
jgi:hypothetical protein